MINRLHIGYTLDNLVVDGLFLSLASVNQRQLAPDSPITSDFNSWPEECSVFHSPHTASR